MIATLTPLSKKIASGSIDDRTVIRTRQPRITLQWAVISRS
jgi:hypothetical protein